MGAPGTDQTDNTAHSRPTWKYPGRHVLRVFIAAFAAVGALYATVWLYEFPHRCDMRRIDTVYMDFHMALHDKDYDSAYSCMSPEYRQAHSLAQFKERFGEMGERWLALEPGRYLRVRGRAARLHPGSDHWPMSGPIYEFVKVGDDWYLTGNYELSVD